MEMDNEMVPGLEKHIGGDGVWRQNLTDLSGARKRPALFLDRDGTIIDEVHYLRRPEDVRFIDGAVELIQRANGLNIPVIIVTNQAGIGRGIFGWREFDAVENRMLNELKENNAFIDAVYACPFHKDAQAPYQHPDPECRKPNPGMLLDAASTMNLDLSGSWIAGDRATDLEAGLNAGCQGGVLVKTGYGSGAEQQDAAANLSNADFSAKIAESIAQIGNIIPALK